MRDPTFPEGKMVRLERWFAFEKGKEVTSGRRLRSRGPDYLGKSRPYRATELRKTATRIWCPHGEVTFMSPAAQMAAAFFNQVADRSKAQAVSAATGPRLQVHPEVLAVMQEAGIDLSDAKPQKLTEELATGM